MKHCRSYWENMSYDAVSTYTSPMLQPSWQEQMAPSHQLSQCLATTGWMKSIKGKIRQGTDEASGKTKAHWSITLLLCSFNYALNNCAVLTRVSGRKNLAWNQPTEKCHGSWRCRWTSGAPGRISLFSTLPKTQGRAYKVFSWVLNLWWSRSILGRKGEHS